jgi:hypothetical protein
MGVLTEIEILQPRYVFRKCMAFITNFLTLKPIKKWFSKNVVFGIITPDGWIGRPFDNHNKLSSLEYIENKVFIGVNGTQTFQITRPFKISKADDNLIISDFNKLEHYYEFLSKPRCKVYDTGVLTFAMLKC